MRYCTAARIRAERAVRRRQEKWAVLSHGPSLGRKRLEDVRYIRRATAHTALHNLPCRRREIKYIAVRDNDSRRAVAYLSQSVPEARIGQPANSARSAALCAPSAGTGRD